MKTTILAASILSAACSVSAAGDWGFMDNGRVALALMRIAACGDPQSTLLPFTHVLTESDKSEVQLNEEVFRKRIKQIGAERWCAGK